MMNEMHFEVGERFLSDMDQTTAGEFHLGYRTTGPRHQTTGGAPKCEEIHWRVTELPVDLRFLDCFGFVGSFFTIRSCFLIY